MMWRFNEFGARLAAKCDDETCITYEELEQLVELFQSKIGRTLVFNLCSNTIGSLAGYAAMINAKIVPVMLASDLDRELLNDLISKYQPPYMWVPDFQVEEFSRFKCVLHAYGYSLLRTDYEEIDLYEELALLLTTSGSTGSPKLVRQSYSNLKANMDSIVEYLELNQDERPITTLPMNYTYGLSIINSHLAVGATILVTDRTLMQKEFWSFLREERATSLGGVPYTYEMLKKLRFFRMPNDSIKTMTQAGGKLSPELHREFAEYAIQSNKKFIVMYGQTEATARMAYLPANYALDKCGSVGIAIPGGEFSLVDTDGNEIEEVDTTGELVYKGANVTLGYALSKEDLNKGDERGGCLETGDMAKRDEDGFYYVVGRKKRFLKMFGKRVNLDEIDELIKKHFPENECASSGVDDHLYIFVTNNSNAEEIKQFVIEKTHLNTTAIRVIFIKEIPRNESGKIRYIELEQYY